MFNTSGMVGSDFACDFAKRAFQAGASWGAHVHKGEPSDNDDSLISDSFDAFLAIEIMGALTGGKPDYLKILREGIGDNDPDDSGTEADASLRHLFSG